MEDKYKYPLYKVFTRANVDSLKQNIKAWLYTYMFRNKLHQANDKKPILDALHKELLDEFSGNSIQLHLYDLDIDLRALIRNNIVSTNPDMEPQKMMQAVQDRMVDLQGERESEINKSINIGAQDLENSEWVNMKIRPRPAAAAAAEQAAAAAAAGQAAAEEAAADAEIARMEGELEGEQQAEPFNPLMRQAEELERAVVSAGNAVTLAEEEAAAAEQAAEAVFETGGGSRRKNTRRKNKNRKKSKRTKSKRNKSKRTKLKR